MTRHPARAPAAADEEDSDADVSYAVEEAVMQTQMDQALEHAYGPTYAVDYLHLLTAAVDRAKHVTVMKCVPTPAAVPFRPSTYPPPPTPTGVLLRSEEPGQSAAFMQKPPPTRRSSPFVPYRPMTWDYVSEQAVGDQIEEALRNLGSASLATLISLAPTRDTTMHGMDVLEAAGAVCHVIQGNLVLKSPILFSPHWTVRKVEERRVHAVERARLAGKPITGACRGRGES